MFSIEFERTSNESELLFARGGLIQKTFGFWWTKREAFSMIQGHPGSSNKLLSNGV